MEDDKPISVKDRIKQFSSSAPSSQPELSSNNENQTLQRKETFRRQTDLTRDNQPQIPQRSEMVQAQVYVPSFGSTSTEDASMKPSDVNKIIKKPPIPKKPKLGRPSAEAEESIAKKTKEQKVGAICISKPTSSTTINKAGQQVQDERSPIDSDQIKKERLKSKEKHVPSSLSDCFTQKYGPRITECLTVKVIDVPLSIQREETGKIFTAVICDATHACIAKVHDSEKITKIQPNAVLILEDFFIRDGEIKITCRTNVYRTGVPLEIPDDIMYKASSLLCGTKHTDKSPVSILDAAISPEKTILSVKGIVYKTNGLEKKNKRRTREKVAFRKLKIKDETSKICVVLWRELAEEPFTINDVVQFNNFQVSNTFRTGKSVPSLTNEHLSSSNIQRLPSESINTEITDSDDDEILSSPKGLLLGIDDLQMYKCCKNGRCNKKKIVGNKCPTCGLSYTETSSGSGFVGKLLVKTDSGQKTYKIFTQQVEHLCKLLDCNIKSTSLEEDIAKKLPETIKFQNNGEKITKISV